MRIGVMRYLPRGVKADYARKQYFDVWLPVLAPSRELLHWLRDERDRKGDDDAGMWKAFLRRYEREVLTNTDARQAILLLAELAKRTPLAIGCYCENESHCHRSRLYEIIQRVAQGLP